MSPSGPTAAAGTTAGTTTTTNRFKSSIHLQTKRPTTRSLSSALPDSSGSSGAAGGTASDASEARFWQEKYGLGSGGGPPKPKFAHPRKLDLKAGTSAVVHQVLFAPDPSEEEGGEGGSSSSSCRPLAAVCGPRVRMYGTTPQSSFYRRLLSSSKSSAYGEGGSDAVFGGGDGNLGGDGGDLPADRQVSTGGELALSADFRSDGRLLAVGTDRGTVRVADVSTRATLCQFRPSSSHQQSSLPVRAVAWFRDGQRVLAAGDDGVVRVWSLKGAVASGGSVPALALAGHGDAVRSALLWQEPINKNRKKVEKGSSSSSSSSSSCSWPRRIAATGSYDHTIRLWNVDDQEEVEGGGENSGTDRCLSVLVHGGPVEALLALPSSNVDVPFWLVSAGGTAVKVWNPRTGRCVQDLDARHRKTITCLLAVPREVAADPDDDSVTTTTTTTRVVTGGLDGLLRVHAWSGATGTLRLILGIALGDAVTAMAYSFAARRLAIGTADGRVLVRQRGPSVSTHAKKRPKPGTYSFFTRGMNVGAAAGDYVVGEGAGKKRKLKGFDTALKQFRYGDALDEALETRIPQVVVAVLEELGKRRGLAIALSNRDEETLEPILAFLVRYINRPRFASLLIGVAHMLLDTYGDITGESEVIDELLDKLRTAVTLEARTQRKLLNVMGQIDAIVAASAIASDSTTSG